MDGKLGKQRDRTIAGLAERQHGVVSRVQLLGAGLGSDVIDGALAAGRLHRLHRGVYAVGHTAIGREARWMSATLAAGAGAVLGERSAGQLWSLVNGDTEPVTVITPRRGGLGRDGVRSLRLDLHPLDTMPAEGMRVTTPARTIVDLNRSLAPRERRLLVERAQDLQRFRPTEIRAIVGRNPRCPGRRPLLDLLDLLEPSADGTASHLERLFLKLVRRAGLPLPACNERILGRRRDFAWPEQRLVVEVDGHAHHSSRAALRRDKRRDRELHAGGWIPARFTFEDVAFEPETVIAELPGLLARAQPARRGRPSL